MYFVYLLKSINFRDQIYVGCTTDIDQRIKTHNNGGSLHKVKYKPWMLHVYLAFAEKQKAYDFEKYLKSHTGKAFANKRLW